MSLRVYELARELGMSTSEMLELLKRSGEFIRSASSPVNASVVDRMRKLSAAERQAALLAPARVAPRPTLKAPVQPSYWAPSDHWEGRKQWSGPDPMTSREAVAYLRGIKEPTIRQWVHRGLLPVAGRRGRSHLFTAADLTAAHRAARQRNRARTKLHPTQELTSDSFDDLVTITQASTRTGISRSTLSSWVRRGRLRPPQIMGKTRLYRLRDVYAVVRKNTPPRSSYSYLQRFEENQ